MHLDAYIVPRPDALCEIDLTLTVHCNAVDEKLCKKVFDTRVPTNWFAFYSRSVLNTSHTASVWYSRASRFCCTSEFNQHVMYSEAVHMAYRQPNSNVKSCVAACDNTIDIPWLAV